MPRSPASARPNGLLVGLPLPREGLCFKDLSIEQRDDLTCGVAIGFTTGTIAGTRRYTGELMNSSSSPVRADPASPATTTTALSRLSTFPTWASGLSGPRHASHLIDPTAGPRR